MKEVAERKRYIQVPDYVEAGDLANEIGKFYMEDLLSAIENHRQYLKLELYFLVSTKKDPANVKKVHINISVSNVRINRMLESCDYWSYDYKTESRKLLWSIPHRTDMKNFLRAPEKYSKDLIKWIRQYIDEENINLNYKVVTL